MGVGQNLVKWLMLIFNLLFWVSGIGLIIAGAVGQTQYKPYLSFLNEGYVSAPVLLIVVGAVISIIAFFGCCGSAKENSCMLLTFAVLLGIIFIVELAGGITGYVERGRVHGYLEENMRRSLGKYNSTAGRQLWDGIQSDFACCGVDDYEDWFNNSTFGEVPPSCCVDVSKMCNRNATELARTCVAENSSCPIFTNGCLPFVENKLTGNMAAMGGVGVGVAFIQLIGIVLACFLARRVRRGYTYSA